jgi:hypothetical protein
MPNKYIYHLFYLFVGYIAAPLVAQFDGVINE